MGIFAGKAGWSAAIKASLEVKARAIPRMGIFKNDFFSKIDNKIKFLKRLISANKNKYIQKGGAKDIF
jgi:hypothetical protein